MKKRLQSRKTQPRHGLVQSRVSSYESKEMKEETSELQLYTTPLSKKKKKKITSKKNKKKKNKNQTPTAPSSSRRMIVSPPTSYNNKDRKDNKDNKNNTGNKNNHQFQPTNTDHTSNSLTTATTTTTTTTPSSLKKVRTLLEQERKPLGAMFKYYATKRSMNAIQSPSSFSSRHSKTTTTKRKYHPTMFMTWPNFSKFCFEFKIIPDLLNKKVVRNMYAVVLPNYNSNTGLQRVQDHSNQDKNNMSFSKSSPESHPGMSFQGFMICLSEIAIQSSLYDEDLEDQDQNAINDNIDNINGNNNGNNNNDEKDEKRIFSLLQWMERSKGKTKMSQSRTSVMIEPFRSTITPIKRKKSKY